MFSPFARLLAAAALAAAPALAGRPRSGPRVMPSATMIAPAPAANAVSTGTKAISATPKAAIAIQR
jgi:hypothetical protein